MQGSLNCIVSLDDSNSSGSLRVLLDGFICIFCLISLRLTTAAYNDGAEGGPLKRGLFSGFYIIFDNFDGPIYLALHKQCEKDNLHC